MLEDISYESQTLVTEMKLFYYASLVMGRAFYYNLPNFTKGHMDFVIKRTRMIPFFISSFILWASLVLVFQAYVDIRADDSKSAAV